jgi:membrane protease YdiL (CAAX protease family)
MDLFTVGGNGVDGGGTDDAIMAAGSAVHGVGSSVLYQDDVVVSRPAVDRVCPRDVAEEVRPRPAEGHIGAGAPKDLVHERAAPRDPKSGRVGGRVWWWLVPFMVLLALEELIPGIPGPTARDFAEFVSTDSGKDFFHGAWGWFALVVVLAIFNTVLGEELLFRGLLLPRMQQVFGKWDWVANGVLFSVYHLHVPWVIPTSLVDIFALAYPSRRFQSAWMGIIVHSAQSVIVIAVVLALVLD